MALATTALLDDPTQVRLTGIALRIANPGPYFQVVVERSPNGTSGWVVLGQARFPEGQGGLYIDALPIIGSTAYYYRIKARADGYTDSAYLGPVSGVPTDLSSISDLKLPRVYLDGVGDGTYLLTTGLTELATVGGLSAQLLVKGGYGLFTETFEQPATNWTAQAGTGTESYPANGQMGGKVYRSTGYRDRIFPVNIPYDPGKLYRIRARVRRQAAGTSGALTIGLVGVAADGVTLVNTAGSNSASSQHDVCADNVTQSTLTTGTWYEYTGWLRGVAGTGSGTPSTDPRSPRVMHTNVRYFRPRFIVNESAGTDTVEIDEITIDLFDEVAQDRLYSALLSEVLLESGVKQTDGAQSRNLVRGRQVFTARHKDVLTFTPAFQAIPRVRVLGGLTYEPATIWTTADDYRVLAGDMTATDATLTAVDGTFAAGDVGKNIKVAGAGAAGATLTTTIASYTDSTHVELTVAASTTVAGAKVEVYTGTLLAPLAQAQLDDNALTGLSASGGTVQARLRQKNTTTTFRKAVFAGGLLDADEESESVDMGTNVPSYDNHYTARFRVELYASAFEQIDITVAIESNDGGGWVTRGSYNYTLAAESSPLSSGVDEAYTYTVTGLGANDDWRVRIADIVVTGPAPLTSNCAVYGQQMEWYTGTVADRYANRTPAPDDFVIVEVEDA